jgi:hypothetical protein
MLIQSLLFIGAIGTTGLLLATIIVVQSDKRAARGRAQQADRILGTLYDSAAGGPWRSIYRDRRPARRVLARTTEHVFRPQPRPQLASSQVGSGGGQTAALPGDAAE